MRRIIAILSAQKLENEQTGENKSTVIPNANVVSYILALGYQIPIQH